MILLKLLSTLLAFTAVTSELHLNVKPYAMPRQYLGKAIARPSKKHKADGFMISRTAKILASRRALELSKKRPLIKDRFAQLFVDHESLEFASKTKDEIHYVMMRHKILDDLVDLNKDKFKQILILGSGFDTKSVRFKHPHIRFVEVDNPAVIEHKKKILNSYGFDQVDTHETYISSTEDLNTIVQDTDSSLPTLVLAEGFFMYLNPGVALDSFKLLAKYYGRNLVVAFDTLSTEYQKDVKNQEAIKRLKEKGGEVFRFYATAKELKTYFGDLGYDLEFWTPDQLQQKYYGSRWRQNNDKFVSVVSHRSFDYRI